jgi:hypothetical protein
MTAVTQSALFILLRGSNQRVVSWRLGEVNLPSDRRSDFANGVFGGKQAKRRENPDLDVDSFSRKVQA